MRFSAVLTARLTPEMAERICACAQQIGVSEGAVVRWAITDFMRRLDLDASLISQLLYSHTPTLPYAHTSHPDSPESQLLFEPQSESDPSMSLPSLDAQPDQTIATDSLSLPRTFQDPARPAGNFEF